MPIFSKCQCRSFRRRCRSYSSDGHEWAHGTHRHGIHAAPRIQARTFEGLARSSDRLSPCPPCDPASHAPDNSRVSTLTVEPDGRPTTECDVETNRPARRDASACRYSGVATSPRERFFVWDGPPRSGLCGTFGPLPPVITVSPAPASLTQRQYSRGHSPRSSAAPKRKAPPKRALTVHACRRHSP